MKILHSADLHLQNEEQIPLVQSLIAAAEGHGAELLLIAGDLFDAHGDGRSLEAALLPIWQAYGGEVLIVPGNHDFKYLQNRSELAPNVAVASQTPFSLCEIEGVRLLCVPYQQGLALGDIELPLEAMDMLVSHGTFGSEAEGYFPIRPADIAGRFRYAALGHYHSWFDKYIEGCLVVNPGAPRQTRKSDRGPRCVSLIDTDSWLTERIVLPVSFTEYKNISVSVLDGHSSLGERLAKAAAFLQEHPNARLNLSLRGSLACGGVSLSRRVQLWEEILRSKGIDTARIGWDLKGVTQISEEILHSSFARGMIDKLSADHPADIETLAPYLLERLQESHRHLGG